MQPQISNPFEEGQVLLINKPIEWTSFDVVRKIRSLIKIKKVGHAGTLDPLATGLLILCTGKFTRRINEFMSQEKEYTGTITLGAVTPTYDLESEPKDFKEYQQLSEKELEAILDSEDESEPVKTEALRELEELAEFQRQHGPRSTDGAQRAVRTVRMAITRFHDHLLEAMDTNGNPHPVLRPFALHLEKHLLTPSARYRGSAGTCARGTTRWLLHLRPATWDLLGRLN